MWQCSTLSNITRNQSCSTEGSVQSTGIRRDDQPSTSRIYPLSCESRCLSRFPEPLAQKNLTLEFSRRPRGLRIWAALRFLGRRGVAGLVERHCRQAKRLAEGLADAGVVVLNRVVLNQVLGTLEDGRDVAAF